MTKVLESDKKENGEKPAQSEDISKAIVHSMPDAEPKHLEKQIEATQKSFELMGKFIQANLKSGIDYTVVEYQSKKTGQWVKSKPFLAKPGSEKFTILFGHRPTFKWMVQDFDKGIFAVKCFLLNKKDTKVVGEGFGSARVKEKANWSENEAMKMAAKRAQIDAALRTYGLSEHFTQDQEAIERKPIVPARPAYQPREGYQPRQEGQFQLREDGSPVTQGQMNMLFGCIDRLGHDKKWLEDWIYSQSQGRVQGVEYLTKFQASKFIDVLLKQEKKREGNYTRTFIKPVEELPTVRYEEAPVDEMPEDEPKDIKDNGENLKNVDTSVLQNEDDPFTDL